MDCYYYNKPKCPVCFYQMLIVKKLKKIVKLILPFTKNSEICFIILIYSIVFNINKFHILVNSTRVNKFASYICDYIRSHV